MKLTSELGHQAQALIARRFGLDFSGRRESDLARCLEHALADSPENDLDAFLHRLAIMPDGSPELLHVACHLTIGETYFFRDSSCFDALERHILPELIAARRAAGLRRLRLWSAGCASGEEPYSLAILIDRLIPDRSDWSITILATDLNPTALQTARDASYGDWAFRQVPSWLQERYFRRVQPRAFELDPAIRRLVTFAPLNLAEDCYPAVLTNTSAVDVVLCRNVLMYFTTEAQERAVSRLRGSLVPGGWMIVSAAEASTQLLHPLEPVSFPGAVIYRNPSDLQAGVLPPPTRPSVIEQPVTRSGVESHGTNVRVRIDLPRMDAAATTSPADSKQPPAQPEKSVVSELDRAQALADQGNLDEARRVCESCLGADRLQPDAYLLLAAICQEQGEIEKAIQALRRAIYLDPGYAAAHFLLGNIFAREGQHQQADRCMKTVILLTSALPPDTVLAGTGGLTTARILETARSYRDTGGE